MNRKGLSVVSSKRKGLSKKIRFEVFKRDSFTCQYCGAKAPDVILEVDHIDPVSKGGDDDLLNLIASCKGCNAGKSDRLLSDDTVLDKRRQQLEELQERREQIDMMFEWQSGLADLDEVVVDKLVDFWHQFIPGYRLNEYGVSEIKRMVRRFSMNEIMQAMRIAAHTYIVSKDDVIDHNSTSHAFKKIAGICYNRKLAAENPVRSEVRRLRATLSKRFAYVNEGVAESLMMRALECGATIEALALLIKDSRNWSQWRDTIEGYIAGSEYRQE